jgi:hypothetical protein
MLLLPLLLPAVSDAGPQQGEQYARLELARRGALQSDDWLIARGDAGRTSTAPPNTTAQLLQLDQRTVALSNNLVARVFTLEPEWSTWDIVSAGRGSALRAPTPEAMVTLDQTEYTVGGMALNLNASAFPSCRQSKDEWYPAGQHAEACPTGWWNRSLPLQRNPSAFQYVAHSTSAPQVPFHWQPARHAPDTPWPPKGVHLEVNFTAPQSAPPQHRAVIVTVHYELLDGAPLMSKWISVHIKSPTRPFTGPDDRAADSMLAGALSLQPCATNPAAAPAEWGFVWLLQKFDKDGAPTNASIQLGGKNTGRDVCMSVVTARADFSNADVGLRRCNASDAMQGWSWDMHTGSLRTLASPDQLRAANIKGCVSDAAASSCCLDINAHVNSSGQAIQMDQCQGPHSWGSFAPLKMSLGTMLQSVIYPSSCVFSTPLPPPPPPPAPPPPKAVCRTGTGGNCVVVRHAAIEILRVNKAWASVERQMPYEQTDITQDVLPFDPNVGSGLLCVRPFCQPLANDMNLVLPCGTCFC